MNKHITEDELEQATDWHKAQAAQVPLADQIRRIDELIAGEPVGSTMHERYINERNRIIDPTGNRWNPYNSVD